MQTHLITQERAQKLDLLVHLITNLKQSLVLCGPEGIGKSTFLSALQEKKSTAWPVVLLQATELLSFDQLQEKLWHALMQLIPGQNAENFIQLFQFFSKNNQGVVLLVDDAHKLAPGLITTLMQFTARHPSLKVVFALTQEELERKSQTDRVIDACHFIDIPPLSVAQCGEYLHYLHAQSELTIPSSKIDDAMAERLYKKTQGIPGKILGELGNLTAGSKALSPWLLIVLGSGAIAAALAYFLWRNMANELTPALNPQTSALAVPGQTQESPQAAATENPEGVTAANPKTTSAALPSRLEIKNSKPDYYSGFTRVRDADALDEFKTQNETGTLTSDSSEQVKVEIIAPEPPPKQVVIAAALTGGDTAVIMDAPAAAPPAKNTLTPPAREAASVDAPPKVAEEAPKPVVSTEKVPPKPVKLPAKPEKLVVEAPKPLPPPKLPKQEVKKEVKPAVKEVVSKKPEPEFASVEERDDVVRELKPEAALVVDNVKPAEVSTHKTPEPVAKKAEVAEPKPEKVLVEASKPLSKPELAPAELAPSVAEKSNATPGKEPEAAKTKAVAVDSNPDERTGNLAKLGVVMKYKADEEHAKPAVVENAKPEKTNPEKSEQKVEEKPELATKKASAGSYTLQVMMFSQQQTVDSFMQKYGSMGGGLRKIKINKDGKEHYVVVYGSYDSPAQANAAKQKLPAELRQAWVRNDIK